MFTFRSCSFVSCLLAALIQHRYVSSNCKRLQSTTSVSAALKIYAAESE